MARKKIRHVGLCSICKHARVVTSARGMEFYRCMRADTDARFSRYPRLPVVSCHGHEQESTPPGTTTQRSGT